MTAGFQNREYIFHMSGGIRVGRVHIRRAERSMPVERHPGAYELLLLESGSRDFWAAGSSLYLRGGDTLLLRPGEKHGQPGAPQGPSSLLYVIFPDPELRPLCGMTPAERMALGGLLRRMPRLSRATAELARCFSALWQAACGASPRWPEAVLRARLVLLLEAYCREAREDTPRLSKDIARAVCLIDEAAGHIPRLGELAAGACLSESRFKQKFRQEMGMPPREYILRQKLRLALERMRSGYASPAGLAEKLGFSSERHFTEVFKRYIGCTPACYLHQMETEKRGTEGLRLPAAEEKPCG